MKKSHTNEYIKFGVVMAGIVAASFALQDMSGQDGFAESLRYFMGVFMVVFASFKLIGYKMFVMMFPGYDIVAKRFKAYAYAFPLIQMALGLAYLVDVLPVTRDVIVLLFTGLASIGVFQEVYKRKSGVHCACLGNVIKLPLSTVSFIEDVGMFVMAATMLAIG